MADNFTFSSVVEKPKMETIVAQGHIEVSDPNNVQETFANGPFNVMNSGPFVELTFTTVRPDIGEIFARSQNPAIKATVGARILLPLNVAQNLARTLAQGLAVSGPAAGNA